MSAKPASFKGLGEVHEGIPWEAVIQKFVLDNYGSLFKADTDKLLDIGHNLIEMPVNCTIPNPYSRRSKSTITVTKVARLTLEVLGKTPGPFSVNRYRIVKATKPIDARVFMLKTFKKLDELGFATNFGGVS